MISARSVRSAGAALCIVAIQASAQTEAELRRWLEQEINDAAVHPFPAGISLEFDEVFHGRLTSEELTTLKQQVRGKPDHPAQQQIKETERRLADGPDVRRWIVWMGDDHHWRINQTMVRWDLPGSYVDHAWNGDLIWQLSGDALVMVSADAAPSGRDFASFRDSAQRHIDALLRGGLGFRADASTGPTISNVSVEGADWSATLEGVTRNGSRVALEFQGRWNASLGRGFVELQRLIDSPVAEAIGESARFLSWQAVGESDLWIAGRVEYRVASGTLDQALEFREAEPYDEGRLDELTRLPSPTGDDAIRGPLTIRTVSDYRPGRLVEHTYEDAVPVGSRSLRTVSQEAEDYRRLGWIAAVLLGCFLAAVALHRRWVARTHA